MPQPQRCGNATEALYAVGAKMGGRVELITSGAEGNEERYVLTLGRVVERKREGLVAVVMVLETTDWMSSPPRNLCQAQSMTWMIQSHVLPCSSCASPELAATVQLTPHMNSQHHKMTNTITHSSSRQSFMKLQTACSMSPVHDEGGEPQVQAGGSASRQRVTTSWYCERRHPLPHTSALRESAAECGTYQPFSFFK